MESLASIYLTAVVIANFVAPKANIPQVLGVRVAQDTRTYTEATGSAVATREEFRQRVQEIKNARKQKIVENLDERLTQLLTKWVSLWSDNLNRLEKILEKVQTKTDRVGEKYDVSEVNAAITTAQEAIDQAKTELEAVKSKDYVFEISDEANLGYDIRSKISEFKEDLKAARASVTAAKEAVHAAIRTLNSVIPDQNAGSDSNEE